MDLIKDSPKISVARVNKALKEKFGNDTPTMRNQRVYDLRKISAVKTQHGDRAVEQVVAQRVGLQAAGLPDQQPKPTYLKDLVRALVRQVLEEEIILAVPDLGDCSDGTRRS